MQPRKFESHILGAAPAASAAAAPVRRPSTCPCPTASTAYEIQSKDGDGVHARARFVEEAKMRAFQGNHIFDFNDKPRNHVEDEEHFSISKLARRRDIKGNDIFGEGNHPKSLVTSAVNHGKWCNKKGRKDDTTTNKPWCL